MILKYKLWFEQEGKVFGKGPFELLKGVEQKGSLSEAAKSLNMSYNKAHHLIKEIESRLGYKLIETQAGGKKGGGSDLTVEAKYLMNKYEAVTQEAEAALEAIFNKHFC